MSRGDGQKGSEPLIPELKDKQERAEHWTTVPLHSSNNKLFCVYLWQRYDDGDDSSAHRMQLSANLQTEQEQWKQEN